MSSKRMTIGIDMDGVCADTLTEWLNTYNHLYNDNLEYQSVVEWDLHKFVKSECSYKIYDILNEQGFFSRLLPIPGCIEVLKSLQDQGHVIIFITSVPKRSVTAMYDKQQWLKKYLPFIHPENFIAAHKKNLVSGVDLLLDDGPHNLEAFPNLTCAMNQPYNQGAESDYRVNNWFEFYDLIQEISKQ